MFLNQKNELDIKTNFNIDRIAQSPTIMMADKVGKLKAQGVPIIGLQTGDPDFKTHPNIIEVATKAFAAAKTHYGPSQGSFAVRTAIAEKLRRQNHVVVDPETEVILTHGGIHAFYIGLQSVINAGDEYIIPDPTWGTHANMVTLLGGIPIRVDAKGEDGFIPTISAWESALTPRTKGIIINYPSNPTGAYPSKAYLEVLLAFCKTHDLWIISDEVYENLYYGDQPISAASLADGQDRVILINSLSKTHAMTGWRVGYLTAPARVISNALKVSQHSITCVAPFVQEAAAFALTDPEMERYSIEMRMAYRRRRQLVLDLSDRINSSNIGVTPPMGAFYYFLDARALGLSSVEISDRLLSEALVGVTAGSAFGKNGEGFIRMTIAANDNEIEQGFIKICEWAGAL